MRKYLLLLFNLASFISFINGQAASVSVNVDNLRYTVDTETQTAEIYAKNARFEGTTHIMRL